MADEHRFTARLHRWSAQPSYFLLTLPEDVSDEVEDRHGAAAAGFGSVRVEVTVGSTTWRTSLFPSSQERAYVLPVKKAVRVAEGLEEDAPVDVVLRPLP